MNASTQKALADWIKLLSAAYANACATGVEINEARVQLHEAIDAALTQSAALPVSRAPIEPAGAVPDGWRIEKLDGRLLCVHGPDQSHVISDVLADRSVGGPERLLHKLASALLAASPKASTKGTTP